MKLSATALALLLAPAIAAPTPELQTRNELSPLQRRDGRACDPTYDFQPEVSGASPNLEDCQGLIDEINQDKTTRFSAPHHTIATHGSCGVGIEKYDGKTAKLDGGDVNLDTWYAHVNGHDAVDFVNFALDNFVDNDKVGGHGLVGCSGDSGSSWTLQWYIFHT
ncbi:hypothetical protein NUU61_003478 [Penicillium alfredii]|uniref:Ecp2 effector protein-like domain-containing protein n=1 Tax=Penicillium alfredii TaxID=1506179 RepID=A0A9W9FJ90_9EURO|nr:uncharacterized protein NUU61_003478 [Penicillium alfredii]KAJ5101256.1 hypothetical protein NUU61_003478 [Penicillium alfredii]